MEQQKQKAGDLTYTPTIVLRHLLSAQPYEFTGLYGYTALD